MKVTSGKLQVGDVKVWKDGDKFDYTQEDVDNENKWAHEKGHGDDVIDFLLSEPTSVKCIKRKGPKNPWKKTGKMLDELDNLNFTFVHSENGYRGTIEKGMDSCSSSQYKTFHEMVTFLYDTAKENGWL